MLIEADCWEVVAAGCAELFPATPMCEGGLILLSALVLWQHGVRTGAQGQSKVSLPLVVCISLHFYSPIHPSTYPPPLYASTHPPTHSPIHPPTHPSIHPSVVIIQSLISSVLIFDLPRARHHARPQDPGSRSRGGERAPRACDGGEHTRHRSSGWLWEMIRARAVSWGPSREFTSGTWADGLLDRGPAWTGAQRQEEGQQGAGSHL